AHWLLASNVRAASRRGPMDHEAFIAILAAQTSTGVALRRSGFSGRPGPGPVRAVLQERQRVALPGIRGKRSGAARRRERAALGYLRARMALAQVRAGATGSTVEQRLVPGGAL